MIGLTRSQHELLEYIRSYLDEKGIPPSFDEMKDGLDLRSKSGIHRMILALEERGFIRRLPNRARAIEIIPHGDPQMVRLSAELADRLNMVATTVGLPADRIVTMAVLKYLTGFGQAA